MSDPNLIQITRPSVVNPVPTATEVKFPTEVINLPSKGWFYPENGPLSKGTIEIKMMTAKEEDILTSENLIKKNVVLDKLLESVLIDKTINPDDILVCDRNALFFALRRLAYGDEYNATITCARCQHENDVRIDLSKLDNKEIDFSLYPKGINLFEFELPSSKIKIGYKLLTKSDETKIERELETYKKLNPEISKEVTTRMTHTIVSVNGDKDLMKIRRFVNEELRARDSLALRLHIKETKPDIDSTFNFSCSNCGAERKEETPLGVTFFWPNK